MVPWRVPLHYRIGGFICRSRGHHRLVLSEVHRFEPSEVIERRPFCTTCWRSVGD